MNNKEVVHESNNKQDDVFSNFFFFDFWQERPLRDDFGWVDGSFGPLVPIENIDHGDGVNYSWGTGNWQSNRAIHFDEDGKRVDPTADELNAQWAVKRLTELATEESEKPFMMAVGLSSR